MEPVQAKNENADDALLSIVQKYENRAGELPALWKIEFKPPYQVVNGRRTWTYRPKNYAFPGVILFKYNDRIVDVRYALSSAYEQMQKRVSRHFFDTKVSVAIVKIPQLPKVLTQNMYFAKALIRKKVMKLYEHFNRQIAKLPIDTTYLKICDLLVKGNSQQVLDILEFKQPYIDVVARPRICTFPRNVYYYRSGVYVIRKNGEVVYVGMSAQNMYGRMYSHFAPFGAIDKSRPNKRLVQYHNELGYYDFDVAIVEVPGIINGKRGIHEHDYKKIQTRARALEEALIALFNPCDNHLKPEEIIPIELSEEDKKKYSHTPFTGDVPF